MKYTPKHYFSRMYSRQLLNSKKRGHPSPDYTRDELIEWLKIQPNVDNIWNKYINSGRDRKFAPSIDRIDDNLPYTLSNIQLMTFEQNVSKAGESMKTGLKKTRHKAVACYHLDGTHHRDFISMEEAAREMNADPANIRLCALGKYNTCKGFTYKFKESCA